MDLVHDRGSMDPVHESGPWTRSKEGVHVLSSPLCTTMTSLYHVLEMNHGNPQIQKWRGIKVHCTCIKVYMVLKWAGVFQEFSTQVSYSIKCTTVYKVWWLFSEFYIF